MKRKINFIKEDFSLNMLRAMGTPKQASDYCSDKLEKIGMDSSRIIYHLSDNTVIKVAYNSDGIFSNRHESNPRFAELSPFARIIETGDNGLYSIMEYAQPLTYEDCVEIFGFTFEQINTWLRYYIHPEEEEELPYFTNLLENQFFIDLKTALDENIIRPKELFFISAWGYLNENGVKRPVIVEYGG